MATLLLTAVGTLVGGPIGGALGAFVGRQADQLIFGGGSRTGPRLKELSVTTSSYGQPIPRNFGRMRVPGTIIWATDLVERSRKEGGGKGKPTVKTYTYSASFAVALSSNPIASIGRIWADGNLLRGAGGDLKAEGAMRVYLGHGDDDVDPIIAADRGASAPAFRDCAYVVFEDLQLADFGNRIPALTFEIFTSTNASVSLDQILTSATLANSNLILKEMRGFSDEGGPLGATLAALNQVYPLCCVTSAGGLVLSSDFALPESVRTLPEQTSRRDSQDIEERHQRRGGASGKEPMALRYYDEDRDYQPGVQRAVGMRPDGRETMVDLPATMTAGGARRIANANAHRARWQDEMISWRIAELDPTLGPGDVVTLPNISGYWRIQNWEWFEGGIELGLKRLAPQLGVGLGSDYGAGNSAPDIVATPTLLAAFELPPEETSNPNVPLIFAAASSASPGWRGAAIFVEQNGSLIEAGVAGTNRAIIGTLESTLGPSSGTLLEPEATLEVSLWGSDLAFESTDISALAMGSNRLLVGGEVLQFLEATPLEERRWRLEGLLRGRAGTEDAAQQGHEAGTTAVLLNDDLTALDPSLVPSSEETRIAALGRIDPDPVYAELQNPGLSRRPITPVAARVTPLAGGVWELCWTRRARGQWRWPSGSDVPLVEEREAYLVGYGDTDAPVRTWEVSETRFEISEPDRSELVSNHGVSDLWVKQIGTFGLSSALKLATLT